MHLNIMLLYVALIITIIFVVILLMKINKLLKTLSSTKVQADSITTQLKLLEIKKEAIAETKAEKSKQTHTALKLLPIALTIYEIYNTDNSLNGISGWKIAIRRYLQQKHIISHLTNN